MLALLHSSVKIFVDMRFLRKMTRYPHIVYAGEGGQNGERKMDWSTLVEPGAVIAVVLFAWNRLDRKMEKLGSEMRTDIKGVDSKIDAQGSKLETKIGQLDSRLNDLGGELRGEIKSLDIKLEVMRTEFRGETKAVEDKIWRLHVAQKGGSEDPPAPQALG
jgi:hypothetical protein